MSEEEYYSYGSGSDSAPSSPEREPRVVYVEKEKKPRARKQVVYKEVVPKAPKVRAVPRLPVKRVAPVITQTPAIRVRNAQATCRRCQAVVQVLEAKKVPATIGKPPRLVGRCSQCGGGINVFVSMKN